MLCHKPPSPLKSSWKLSEKSVGCRIHKHHLKDIAKQQVSQGAVLCAFTGWWGTFACELSSKQLLQGCLDVTGVKVTSDVSPGLKKRLQVGSFSVHVVSQDLLLEAEIRHLEYFLQCDMCQCGDMKEGWLASFSITKCIYQCTVLLFLGVIKIAMTLPEQIWPKGLRERVKYFVVMRVSVCVRPRSSRDWCDSGGRAANPVQKKSNSHKMQELLCEQLSLNLLHMTVITSYQNMTDFCLWFQVDAFLTGGNIFHCTLLLHLYCETVFFLILIVNLSF